MHERPTQAHRHHAEKSASLESAKPGVASVRIAVIIPAYRVTQHIEGVLARIGPDITRIYVVDDHCPDASGDYVERRCSDSRITVIRNEQNQGVGGAVVEGYRAAIADNMDILVKVDGDGQMDATLIPDLIEPIVQGFADYTKGNRFYAPEALDGMPLTRLIGNAGLSFLAKASSGYWDLFDPTNGFTAIHAKIANLLPLNKLAKRYFFESDMLFRLNIVRAVAVDVPMASFYGEETSNLDPTKIALPFLRGHLANTLKRIAYSYFLRGFSFASFCLVFGLLFMGFALLYGGAFWLHYSSIGQPAPTGTIMLAALPLIVGFQLLMGFFAADMASAPSRPLHTMLSVRPSKLLQPFQDRPPTTSPS